MSCQLPSRYKPFLLLGCLNVVLIIVFIVQRESFDEELAAIPPEEREAYLKEYDEADKTDNHKQGGLIEKCKLHGNCLSS